MITDNKAMHVRGIAFSSRKANIIHCFGADRWESFIKRLAERCPVFRDPVYPLSKIPVNDFLIFIETIVVEFYNNNNEAMFAMGEESAKWSFTEGTLKPYLSSKNLKGFTENLIPLIWKQYYDFGSIKTSFDDKIAKITLEETPDHVYFEYLIVGFVRETYKLLGAKVTCRRITGLDSPNRSIHYEFDLS